MNRSRLRQAALRLLAHLVALWPLWWAAEAVLADRLGADPIAVLTHHFGDWTLRLLLLTLAVTPLRRFTSINIVPWRRMLGLHAFFNACLHLGVYLVLDLGGYWEQVFEDIIKRPYITVGFLAWLLLVPLAATSTRAAMRRLGRNWSRLHRLVYLTAGLAVLHFLWLVKADLREPLIYAAILATLLLARWPKSRGLG